MEQLKWGTPEDLRVLLIELVGWKSVTLTEGESEFPVMVHEKLKHLPYFQENTQYLKLHEVDSNRSFLTALYKYPGIKQTIVLMSHFDTVGIEEYGDLEPYAYQPNELTELLKERIAEFPEDIATDILSGDYLFGRGTMDMKMGLAMHMGLLEKATSEKWPINIMLLSVPDEEVNSAGMREAVRKLVQMKEEYELEYKLFVNGEPVFSQEPGDESFYVYSGSIGKIMPSALFYGKETHVGEPLAGITANYIASFLTQRMEWNSQFQESVMGEATPLPVTLQQKDLKMEYSVQTPYRAAALYNVFLMERTAADIMDIFEMIAKEAAYECNQAYQNICKRQGSEPIGEVQVIRYQFLEKYAIEKHGLTFVSNIKQQIEKDSTLDEREKCIRVADSLLIQCQELAPAIVLLFTPPYYPAVCSSTDQLVTNCIRYLKAQGKETFELPITQIHFFNGISDLSYVNYQDDKEGWTTFTSNTPTSKNYQIPFDDMKQLNAPVLNLGPFGRDAHKRTERLHIKNAFVEVPKLLEGMIKMLIR
ncbi:M20/M25/M40 family metallo-hydrolase [Fredinandcohnia humi]